MRAYEKLSTTTHTPPWEKCGYVRLFVVLVVVKGVRTVVVRFEKRNTGVGIFAACGSKLMALCCCLVPVFFLFDVVNV